MSQYQTHERTAALRAEALTDLFSYSSKRLMYVGCVTLITKRNALLIIRNYSD
jgi:hypothetical protein